MTQHTITVSRDQLELLLKAMSAQLQEDDRYLLGNSAPAQPQPHNLCCAYHRAEYERDKAINDALIQRRNFTLELIDKLDQTRSAPSD